MESLGQIPVDESRDIVPPPEEGGAIARHGEDEEEHCGVNRTGACFCNNDTWSEGGSIPRLGVFDQF